MILGMSIQSKAGPLSSNNDGSFAILVAMPRASSSVRTLALRVTQRLAWIDVGEGLLVSIHDFEATWNLLNGPGWWEAPHR